LQLVVPQELLISFSSQELELVACGPDLIDIDDWEQHSSYSQPFHAKHPIIIWFWEILRSGTQEFRRQCLQFATGLRSPPAGGFSRLFIIPPTRNDRYTFTIRFLKDGSNHLPIAHTCFLQLDVPSYKSKRDFEAKLRYALQNGLIDGFQML
ncbi:MAG: putative E3 ubiquitin-protein ligase NEDD4, partial [Streblomastix strix]